MNRRTLLTLSTAALAGAALPYSPRAKAAEIGDNGLHMQPFFLDSFLDISEDLTEAADEGKHLAVIFEQRGCPYCREMHTVNFADDRITDFMTEHFNVLQLDLWGSREVTDLDGEALEERALAGKWGVNFTPTTVFLAAGKAGAETLKDAEVFRMPGYFKPFHFLSAYEYVQKGEWDKQPFQRYLQDKFADLEAKGITPEVW